MSTLQDSCGGLTGVLHDFGKYSDCFQQMLQTGKGRCQHAIHGAMLAYFGAEGAAKKPGLNTVMAAIAGHHAGLADWSNFGRSSASLGIGVRLRRFLTKGLPTTARSWVAWCPDWTVDKNTPPRARKARFDLFVRMLFQLSSGCGPVGLWRSVLRYRGSCAPPSRLNTLLQHVAALQKMAHRRDW